MQHHVEPKNIMLAGSESDNYSRVNWCGQPPSHLLLSNPLANQLFLDLIVQKYLKFKNHKRKEKKSIIIEKSK